MSFRNRDEDLFEESRMSFGEHLEELRWVLIKCLIALAVGCCVGFYFAEDVVTILNVPLEKAINNYQLADAKERMVKDKGYIPPDVMPWFKDGYVPQRGAKIDILRFRDVLQRLGVKVDENAELNPLKFSKADFESDEVNKLVSRLTNLKTDAYSNEAQLKAVWSRIPKTLQIRMEDIAKKSKSSDSDLETIVEAFNQVAESDLNSDEAFAEQLVEPGRGFFAKMFSKGEEKPLAKMKSWLQENPDDSAANTQLNRALVHGVFKNEMPPPTRSFGEMPVWVKLEFQPQSLATTDAFLIWLKAGIITGLLIALPAILWFLWTFVAAGLYPHEQKYVYIFLPISLLLFFAGVCLAFFFVFAPVLDFLFSFNRSMGIAPEMRINEWLSFVMFLPLGFGIAFQLPLVMLFVNRIGVVSVEAYIDKWRIAVMVISVLSMLLTPADPISMILMAGPLTVLYFLGIAMCKWMPSPANSNPFNEATA